MARFDLYVTIEAPNLAQAWRVAASLPLDLRPQTVEQIARDGQLISFTLTDETNDRSVSFSLDKEED